MYALGIDIGTTGICVLAININTGKVEKIKNFDNDSNIKTLNEYEKIQDVNYILNIILKEVQNFEELYHPLCIGISTQMHGILYLDEKGDAVSPLFTWQDSRGNLNYDGDITYAEKLSQVSGYKLSSGFGMVTHFWHVKNNCLPENAKQFATIGDYIAMKLARRNKPLMHISNAHSIGMYDFKKQNFDKDEMQKVGLSTKFLPALTAEFDIVGTTDNNTKVAVCIGDNQASFIGSVKEIESSVLVNVGTGSQISFCVDEPFSSDDLEARPLYNNKYLACGASLCGGRAYALLEHFFAQVVEMATGKVCENLYGKMSETFLSFKEIDNPLKIKTTFDGTRFDVNRRGSIDNIGINNFTPIHMIEGFINGTAQELHGLYQSYESIKKPCHNMLVGAGNGIRKNKALMEALSNKFEMQMSVPTHKEEAAVGAAISALVASGVVLKIEEGTNLIKY